MTQYHNVKTSLQIPSSIAATPLLDMKSTSQVPPVTATHTVPPPLTIDCLEEILNHLLDSRESLHSCILVNRIWSQLAMPLLWYNPFGSRLRGQQAINIFDSYISCLPEELKDQMLTRGVYFSDLSKPLFDYPKYLRGFDWFNFQMAVREWVETFYYHRGYDFSNKIIFLEKFMASFLLGRCNGLRILRLESNSSTSVSMLDLLNTFNFRFLFSKIEKFEVQYNTFSNDWGPKAESISLFSTKLAACSRNIQHIKLSIETCRPNYLPLYICEAFWYLIEKQKNLKILDISEFWNPEKSDLFYSSLIKQSHSLTFLSLRHISKLTLLLQFLTSCKNLETLELWTIPVADMEALMCLSSSSTHLSIKKLRCYDVDRDPELTLGIIILMTNWNLKELHLLKVTPKLLEVISQYCPNLTCLHLNLNKSLLMKLLKYISTLSLDTLGLINQDKTPFSIESLQEIARAIPPTTRNLEINFFMTSQGLQYFLWKFRGTLRKLVISNDNLNDQYLAVITYYAKSKNLQEFWFPRPEMFSSEALENAKFFIPIVQSMKPRTWE
ncbi:13115_t:CDS:1 [Acaulospora colombiana]|uniref:13115_t:CDS:1 n=1 Tax=Acaulospora colombiana TaxID=27376 RepID=A0ACA9LUS9_9GLOM|nr:13115_t:CDS:1 [Acaulospora colombiana]